MGLKSLLIGILVSGLFALALINGGIMLASNNHANQSIGDDPILVGYRNSLNNTLHQAETNVNGSLEALGQQGATSTPLGAIYDAMTGTWKTLKEVPSSLYNLFVGVTKVKIFGDSFNPVFGIVAAILIILIIFGVIKLIISGDDN